MKQVPGNKGGDAIEIVIQHRQIGSFSHFNTSGGLKPHLPVSVGGGKSSGHDRIDIANRNEVGKRLVYRDEDSGESTLIGQTRHPLDTEAACKTLVKQRMCLSGSRWRDTGASCVLALRSLKLTKDRWQQFWGYVMRHGCTA